jgi:hypothetical protein
MQSYKANEGNSMKKERLVVMNGQKIVQVEKGPNEWTVEKVEKANGIRPGYYNLYGAQAADKTKMVDGVVLHADADAVYQLEGRAVIRHSSSDFDKVPDSGSAVAINYVEGRAVVTSPQKLSRGKTR